jgi:integrase
MVPARYSLLVELVASTGLRISEAIGLQRKHLHLDGERPHLKVRRAIVKRRIEPPKTRHGKRSVPVSPQLVSKLRAHLATLPDDPDQLVFASRRNTPLDPDNLRTRMLKALMEEIGAPWAAWHTLRHTYASLMIASGVNVVQLSHALGHHSAAFTLQRYVHLLKGDEAPALDLAGLRTMMPIDERAPAIAEDASASLAGA